MSLRPSCAIIIRGGRLTFASFANRKALPVNLFKTAAFAAALALSAVGAAQAQISPSPAAVHAGAYKTDPAHSKITWSVTHFGFSTYIGQFSHVDATLKVDPKAVGATALDVTVDANSLGTLNPALDTHLKSKDFLDVAAFPTATFKAVKVTQTGEKTADIAGELTLHGVTKPVVVHATFMQGGVNPLDKKYSLGFAGTAEITRSEFGIKSYVPAISDKVTLTIEAEFKAAPAA
jgi:polyisoprenoid-binding protein YceI